MGQIGVVGPAAAWYPEGMQEPATHIFRFGDLVRIRDGDVNNQGTRLAHGELGLVSLLDGDDTLWDIAINTAESAFIWTSSKHLEPVQVADEVSAGLRDWIADHLAEKTDARTAEIVSWGHKPCETAVHLLQLAFDRGAFVQAEHVGPQPPVETSESMTLYGRLCEAIGAPPGVNPIGWGRAMRDKRFRLQEAVRQVPQAAALYSDLYDRAWLPEAIKEADCPKCLATSGPKDCMKATATFGGPMNYTGPVEQISIKQADKREARAEIVFGGARSFPQESGFKVGEWVDLANKDDTGVKCWLWRIAHRPPGSETYIGNPAAAHPGRVTLDVPGEYVFDLFVNDGHGPRRTSRSLIAMVDERTRAESTEAELKHVQGVLAQRERQGRDLVEILKPYIPAKMNEPEVFAGVRGALARIADLERALRQILNIVGPGDTYPCDTDADPAVSRVRREVRDMRATFGVYRAAAEALWKLLDDIDTADDQIKPLDAAAPASRLRQFRERAMEVVKRRHAYLVSDGHTLTLALPSAQVAAAGAAVQGEINAAQKTTSGLVLPNEGADELTALVHELRRVTGEEYVIVRRFDGGREVVAGSRHEAQQNALNKIAMGLGLGDDVAPSEVAREVEERMKKAVAQREKLKECINERGRLLDVLIAVGYTAHSGETAVTAAIDLLQGIAKLVWEERGIKRDDILIDRLKDILVMWDEAVLETKKLHEKLEGAQDEVKSLTEKNATWQETLHLVWLADSEHLKMSYGGAPNDHKLAVWWARQRAELLAERPGPDRISALERDSEAQRQRIRELTAERDTAERIASTPGRIRSAFERMSNGHRVMAQTIHVQVVQAAKRKTKPPVDSPLPAPGGCFRRIEITSKDGRPRTRFWYARHDGTAYVGGEMTWAHESGETMTIEGQPVDQIVIDGTTARVTVRAGSDGR